MAHRAIIVALLFSACVYASPAPKPDKTKFTLAKDSSAGFAAALGNSKALGVADSNVGLDTPVESPVDTGDNAYDITVLDNVNTGYAVANGGSVAAGLLKNNKFAKDPTKPAIGIPPFGPFR